MLGGTAGVVAVVAAATAGLALVSRLRWESFLRGEQEAVRRSAQAPVKEALLSDLLVGLPSPVQRFFLRSISGKCIGFRLWTTRCSGALRFNSASGWKALQAETVAAVGPEPSFCYTGCLQLGLGRLLPCRGREALLQGHGAMAWRLWGALPLASSEGGRLDQSALLRWLAEAVCFPPALLPSPHLRWLPAEPDEGGGPERSAHAVLNCRGASVSAVFTFDGEGRFQELVSHDYWRVMPDGTVQQVPWRACCTGRHTRFRLSSSGGSSSGSGSDDSSRSSGSSGSGGSSTGGGSGSGGGSVEVPTELEAAWLEPDGTADVYVHSTVTALQAE